MRRIAGICGARHAAGLALAVCCVAASPGGEALASERDSVLVSFQAERTLIEPGGRVSSDCITWMIAKVHPAVAGVRISFEIGPGTGGGLLAPACLSTRRASTGDGGTTWVALLSSDRPERCVVVASAGGVRLSKAVTFKADPDESVLVFLQPGGAPTEEPYTELTVAEAARLAALTERLGDPDAMVRTKAKRALVSQGRKAVGVLTQIIYDPAKPRHVRGIAATALGEIKDSLAIRRLARALTDTRSYVRSGGARGLARHSGAVARRYVAEALKHPMANVRASALHASAGMGMKAATIDLIAAAGDPDAAVRATSAWLLKAAEGAEAAGTLRKLLADPEPFVRYAAAKAMILSGDRDLPAELLRATADPFPGVRGAAARAIGLRPKSGGFDALGRLAGDPDARVRRNAALALGDRGTEAEARRILTKLAGSDDSYAAGTARRAICMHGTEAEASLIVSCLDSTEEEIVVLAAAALRRLTRRDISYPGDGTPEQKKRAVSLWKSWWERHGPEGRLRWLLASVRERSSTLRGEAALELVELGHKAAGADAKRLLRDRFWQNRHGAALALSKLGDYSGTPIVAADLADRRWYVRSRAVDVLGRLGDTKAVEGLMEHALDDASEPIREKALAAIRRLTASQHGFDPAGTPLERQRAIARWKKWWDSERARYPGPKGVE